MTQTEYLVSRGAPPLPQGWDYVVWEERRWDAKSKANLHRVTITIYNASGGIMSRVTIDPAGASYQQHVDLMERKLLTHVKQAYHLMWKPPATFDYRPLLLLPRE